MVSGLPLALDAYVRDWLDLLLRWLHVIAAMAWIGTSFYFVLLDQSLRFPRDVADREAGVGGELWEVHGGGFYHVQKYRVAPRELPDHLAWFKWEAYTTWLSGFALLLVLYYLEASSTLVDRSVLDLEAWQAVAVSVALLALAWVVYDALNRVLADGPALWATLAGLVLLSAWGASELFAPRAAWLQVGAMIGTVMAANVFFDIIPAHRELVRAKQAGREPDRRPGEQAKQRSVHNNYLTLPVLVTMLAGHFPVVVGARHAWLVLAALMALGVVARVFFNLRHRGRTHWWLVPATAVALAGLAVAVDHDQPGSGRAASAGDPARGRAVFASAGCAACHTLAAAGATGRVGPDLDAVRPSAALVAERVTNGKGAMPSFRSRLTAAQIADVAAYVSTVAGR